MSEMINVLVDVGHERDAQDEKWGDQSGHSDLEWLAILAEEFGEVAHDANELHFRPDSDELDDALACMRRELIQVAAVAVAWVEALDGRR